MKTLNVVDASAWLEYLADTERAGLFARAIEDAEHLLVPVITLHEVFKKVLRERGESEALEVASVMQSGRLIGLDGTLALEAARHPLPLADSLIYATARHHRATLWTQDEHFRDLPDVRYFPILPAG
jgi:predicted nucleic acid-binding protein